MRSLCPHRLGIQYDCERHALICVVMKTCCHSAGCLPYENLIFAVCFSTALAASPIPAVGEHTADIATHD